MALSFILLYYNKEELFEKSKNYKNQRKLKNIIKFLP